MTAPSLAPLSGTLDAFHSFVVYSQYLTNQLRARDASAEIVDVTRLTKASSAAGLETSLPLLAQASLADLVLFQQHEAAALDPQAIGIAPSFMLL